MAKHRVVALFTRSTEQKLQETMAKFFQISRSIDCPLKFGGKQKGFEKNPQSLNV